MKKKEDMIQVIKELEQFIPSGRVTEIIEKLQQDAFMEGYQYAILLLQESMGKQKD